MDTWRLILSAPADGFTNMAVDEAMLKSHALGLAPPTVRIYAWSPLALSVGYFQRALQEIDLDACARAGIDVVRRLTGGRGVLHADEVTYSVAVREDLLPDAGVMEAYRAISAGLIAGLRRLGLEARLAPGQRREAPSGADCFAATARCDLVFEGKKICGAAQVRRMGAIMQHGSLPIALPDASPYWRQPGLPPNAVDLATALGRRPEWEEVAGALAAGFAEALGAPLAPGTLNDGEMLLARRLRSEKYATDVWNLSR